MFGQLLGVLLVLRLPIVAEEETYGQYVVLQERSRWAYFCKNESCSDPHSASAKSKSSCERLSVEDTTCCNHLNGLAGHRALVPFAELSNCRDQDSSWDISRVASTFSSLGANHIHAQIKALLHVLRMSDHVHVEHASLVELLHDVLWWDTDGRDEETGAGLDCNVNQLVELALGVVVAMEG